MIKVNLIVKRHEDRVETEFSFDSSESKVEYVQALAEFLRKKVYEESGTASRYREHTSEKNGVLSYTVRMDFQNRRQIADALKTQDVGKLSKYYQEFEKAAHDYIQTKFAGGPMAFAEDVRLTEPQKVPFFRSRSFTAVTWGGATFVLSLAKSLLIMICSCGRFRWRHVQSLVLWNW